MNPLQKRGHLAQAADATIEPSPLQRAGATVILFGSLALTAWVVITEFGPVRWFMELQASITGGDYYPVLTGILIWLVVLLPLAALWVGIVRLIEGPQVIESSIERARRS